MKIQWTCIWEIIYADKCKNTYKGKKTFASFEQANEWARGLIAEELDLSNMTKLLKKSFKSNYAKNVIAFLKNYTSDPQFPHNEQDLIIDESDMDFDLDFYVSSGSLDFHFEDIEMKSTLLLKKPNENDPDDPDAPEKLKFTFYNEYGTAIASIRDMSIIIDLDIEWGTSANPIMVLQTLQRASDPLTIRQIAESIRREYCKKIERKAVGRIIKMLKYFGYRIQASQEGYLLIK